MLLISLHPHPRDFQFSFVVEPRTASVDGLTDKGIGNRR
jgi:hypothetical protein